ncbi:hypothetical protein QZJ86_11145 [Methylomonas montana]|uniref:hypothetical protein n=1 Tax=Methylomonas montana TaxID=3058963 RepID=UPI00265B4929|nr:hypothetical protein [Methylomonas montana]WKJ88581.1 hypothetical protein QZJ86_11145 [Methylomonas montana]
MNEFLNRIAEESEAGNFDEVFRLSKSFNIVFFNNSLFEELTETAYFPSLNPDISDEVDPNKTNEELRKEALERVIKDPALAVLAPWDSVAIKEITDYDFISLFEAALLIGYRVDNDPRLLVFSSPELFLDAIISKQIDPREPHTFIPLSKLHESPKVVNGEVFFIKETPDLSWKLSLKEVAEFAIAKGYPEHLFADLLNEATGQLTQNTVETVAENIAEANHQERQSAPDIQSNNTSNPNKSDQLAILNQASARFWQNADRNDKGTWPDNKTVAAWLMGHKFSERTAKAGTTIIRPDWAATGRRPKEQ